MIFRTTLSTRSRYSRIQEEYPHSDTKSEEYPHSDTKSEEYPHSNTKSEIHIPILNQKYQQGHKT